MMAAPRSMAPLLAMLLACCNAAALAQVDLSSWINGMTANALAQAGMAQVNTAAFTNQAIAQAALISNAAQAQAQQTLKAAMSSSGGKVGAKTCGTLSSSTSSTAINGATCAVTHRVAACNGLLTAGANINGRQSTCCVALLDSRNGFKPGLVCAAGFTKPAAFMALQSSEHATVQPSCAGGRPQLQCTISLSKVPYGWVAPSKTSWSDPFTVTGASAAPCLNSRFKTLKQVTLSRSPLTVQSQCS
jgi:hypothetical protein